MHIFQHFIVCAVFIAICSSANAAEQEIYVNNQLLKANTITQLEAAYQTKIQNGRYWYDRVSGAWGVECGPAAGIIAPNLALGGKLQRSASCGYSGVIINGRELNMIDVKNLYNITGQVIPGNYWVDAQGNAGYVGGPAFVNLYQLAQQKRANSVYRYKSSSASGVFSSGCSGISVKQANGSTASAYVGC